MTRRAALLLLLLLLLTAVRPRLSRAQDNPQHLVQPGDTWTALALRSGTTPAQLLQAHNAINPQRQPAIATVVSLPTAPAINGQLLRPLAPGLLQIAVENGRSPWSVALGNSLPHPYRPSFYAPLVLHGGSEPPRELPPGFSSLDLGQVPAQPGRALTLDGHFSASDLPTIELEGLPWAAARRSETLIALGGTGAFYPPGQPALRIHSPGQPLWEQPLLFLPGEWTFEQVNFNGTAVYDPDELRLERERLQAIWDEVTPRPLWHGDFGLPLTDYVEVTSLYGARRSVNGGPYNTYHEGTDFSAYGGTPVYAPAGGRVVLAETLNVRGGAVILDHGLGLHSGYYHLSAILVEAGQRVQPGDLLGKVGTTGRSTGNHLHWDLLVGRTWVDPQAWQAGGLPAQISSAWPPPPLTPDRAQPAP